MPESIKVKIENAEAGGTSRSLATEAVERAERWWIELRIVHEKTIRRLAEETEKINVPHFAPVPV